MHILFVCTGNTCRSPMAEAILRREIEARGLQGITVGSAGVGAWDGASASDGALLVAMENGLDLGAHRSRQLTPDIVRGADLLLVMGAQHRDRVETLGGGGRTHLLTHYASGGAVHSSVADPYGGDLEAYRATFAALEREIQLVVDRLAAERAGPRRATGDGPAGA